jgi:hypothetical protein
MTLINNSIIKFCIKVISNNAKHIYDECLINRICVQNGKNSFDLITAQHLCDSQSKYFPDYKFIMEPFNE